MTAILTVDIGTTSIRACLFDTRARLLHLAVRDNVPQFLDDGRVEQDPLACRAAVHAVLQACAAEARQRRLQPLCIALTAQRSSVIAVDAAGQALHPAIHWQDRRTAALAQELAWATPQVYQRSGLKVSPVFSALKMRWLRLQRPDLWARTHKLLGFQDWIVHGLTARYVTDHSFASRTNLFDLEQRCWSPELLELFGVPAERLCELAPPGSVVGGLTPAAAAGLGLPTGLPVLSAGGDQQCAALGLGLFSSARVVANTGTGSYLIGHSTQPVRDPAMGLSCNVSAVAGAYIVEAAVLTSGTIYRWLDQILTPGSPPVSGADGFAALNALAAAAPPGAHGVVMLPHFKGSGSPHWDPQARGVFFNLQLDTARGDLARAVLEGIAVEMQANLERIEALCGTAAAVSVAGGLTRLDAYNQIQADVFERPVERPDDNEATSAGAWIAAAVATGVCASYAEAFARVAATRAVHTFNPRTEYQPVYRRLRRQAGALYQALCAEPLRAAFYSTDEAP